MIKRYISLLPLVLLVVYILLNQFGCVGKTIDREVQVRDTILQVRHDSFMVKIPEPVEKRIYIKVREQVKDSMESVYANRINDLERSIVEYKNAILKIKEGKPGEPEPVITANEYKDTFDTDTYSLRVVMGVIGHLESFDYSLDQFEKAPKPCPRVKNKMVLFGIEANARGHLEPKLGYGSKNLYVKGGYTFNHPDGHSVKNASIELGGVIKF